jgi:hypothetical protein
MSLPIRPRVLLVSLAFGALALTACGPTPTSSSAQSAQPAKSAPTTASAPASTGSTYPADVVQNFMDSCVAGAAPSLGRPGAQRTCSCALDGMQKRYTLQEFSRIEVAMAAGTGQVPTDVLNIVADCRVSAR